MAPNRQFNHGPQVSSSEEEDEALSEEHEVSDSDNVDDEEEDKTSPSTPPKVKKPSASKKSAAPVHHSSSDDSESGSDSDSGSGDLIVKPIASKPMEEDPPKATKKPRSKTNAPTSATPVKSAAAGGKRTRESDATREVSKRAKKKASTDGAVGDDTPKKASDDSKKQLFQRLWSEDDEIAILKGMIDYTAKKGADPLSDMTAFHEFVKDKLHVDVSKNQLYDKIRRLKKKFMTNATKGSKGKDPIFPKAHEQNAYELSKKVWATEANNLGNENTKVNGSSKRNNGKSLEVPKVDTSLSSPDRQEVTRTEVDHIPAPFSTRFNKSIGDSSLEEEIIKDGIELIKGAKRIELDEKWKQLKLEEVELYLKRIELIQEQTKLVLEALKSSGH